MGLSPGTRLGPYEIAAPLGAGGMGEVYRARDTRLGRDVAIKVLPADLTATPEARARFEREARAISHLNHPNICTLHDVGREGGTDFLVMELITGGSLRDRLERKALPLPQVLDLGIQIADALEAAHARGIVHRDLKPGNVLLTERGQVKVMDFGLATVGRGRARAAGAASATGASATETEEHLTSPGQTVGTVTYMSPEQARGEEVDARSDLFALGAVLYEMTSGHRAFEGSSTAVIFEAILNRTPAPVSLLRPDTPQELDRILGKALEKDRELRYQTAAEVRSDLKRLKRDIESSRVAGAGAPGDSGSRVRSATSVGLPASAVSRRRTLRIAGIAAVAIAIAGVTYLAIRFTRPGIPRESVRLSIEAPPGIVNYGTPHLSPDGRYLAFIATDTAQVRRIWIRPMDGTAARPLPGTEDTMRPFWSPDSRSLAFCARGKLKTINIAGGEPATIFGAAADGCWGSKGTILLDSSPEEQIQAVNATGGQPTQATWPDKARGEVSATWPEFLPDGEHFLYLAGVGDKPDSTALRVGRLGSRESKVLLVGLLSHVHYVEPGYILFQKDRSIFAREFDARGLRFKGDAVLIVDDAILARDDQEVAFSASSTGTLAYLDELTSDRSRVAWVDRTGRETGTLGPVGVYGGWGLSLSPDEQRVAVSMNSPGDSNADIWLLDVARDVATRFTSSRVLDQIPVWSTDGSMIYYHSFVSGAGRIWAKASTGTAAEQELGLPPGEAFPMAATPDGRTLLGSVMFPGKKWDIAAIALDGTLRVTPLGIESGAMGRGALEHSISPDGKWLAYMSRESGGDEVYVVDYPGVTNKWRVSFDGGSVPLWSRNGKELYFLAPDGTLMATPVTTTPAFHAGRPARILQGTRGIIEYSPTSNPNRFLVKLPATGEPLPPTRVILNWPAAQRRR